MNIGEIPLDRQRLGEFCSRWGVTELALFGSILRDDFDPDRSDVDVLVEFSPNTHLTLFKIVRMSDELAEIFGRRVDLVPKDGLKPALRQPVLAASQVLYVAA